MSWRDKAAAAVANTLHQEPTELTKGGSVSNVSAPPAPISCGEANDWGYTISELQEGHARIDRFCDLGAYAETDRKRIHLWLFQMAPVSVPEALRLIDEKLRKISTATGQPIDVA